jgi:ecotin
MKSIKLKCLSILVLAAFLTISNNAIAQKKTTMQYEKLEIEMFPQPKKGYKRVYIQVPINTNAENLQVEFFVGKNELVDCNMVSIAGQIKEEILEGWGYNYYTVETNGEIISTLMGCPDQKKTKKFITLPPQTTRYNSRLPIVVYVPQQYEVKYRFWRADASMQSGKE